MKSRKPKTEDDYRVTCPKCGNSWYLEPTKWRNLESILRTGKKTIFCPFCGHFGTIPENITRILMMRRVKALEQKC